MRAHKLWSLAAAAVALVAAAASAQAGSFVPIVGPVQSTWATATALGDGKVLITGGLAQPDGSPPTDAAWLFDPVRRTFAATAPMLANRAAHAATVLTDGRVLVTGGADPGTSGDVFGEIYDPPTGTFDLVFTPSGLTLHTATLLRDGKVLLAGGQTPGAWLYDPALDLVSPTGPLTKRRAGHTATLLADGRVLVWGGLGPSNSPVADLEIYDPDTGVFTALPGPAGARAFHTATLLGDGRVLVLGGDAADFAPPSGHDIYDPATGAVTSTPDGAVPLRFKYHTATLLADGTVLVAGGYDGTPRASAYLFDP